MPCPTCNHPMIGLGVAPNVGKLVMAIMNIRDHSTDEKDCGHEHESTCLGEIRREAAKALDEMVQNRYFWCPQCGTRRTVTNNTGAFTTTSGSKGYCISNNVNHDSPPKLVEAIKAADDARQTANLYPGEWLRIPAGATWAFIRRCIGRERP